MSEPIGGHGRSSKQGVTDRASKTEATVRVII